MLSIHPFFFLCSYRPGHRAKVSEIPRSIPSQPPAPGLVGKTGSFPSQLRIRCFPRSTPKASSQWDMHKMPYSQGILIRCQNYVNPCEPLPDDFINHPACHSEPSQSLEESHIRWLYLPTCSFGPEPQITYIG